MSTESAEQWDSMAGAAGRTAIGATEALDSWVVAEQKIVYVAVAKNASTSTKWMLADLTNQDRDAFRARIGLAPTRWQTIHARPVWRGVSALHELSDEQRREISPENGWFVFSVIRDPRLRAWSAWQSKFLIGNPTHAHTLFAGEPWLPRLPESAQDVIEDFAQFVALIGSDEGSHVRADDHFTTQWRRLGEGAVPYSRLYDISEISQLLEDLGGHLAQQGFTKPLTLGRENSTPLAVSGRLFTPEVRSTLERVYADDFVHFGDRWDFEPVLAKDPEWSKDAFRDIAARVGAGGQIADLSHNAKRIRADLRTEVRRLEKITVRDANTIADLRRTLKEARNELDSATKTRDTLKGKAAAAKTENSRLKDRVAALELALHHRTLRGFPGAVIDRIRRITGRERGI